MPAPGTLPQFYEMVSFLNTPLLDRDQPMWECYVIDGIEDNHVAIMVRVHHALIDGGGALKLFRAAMSDKASDKTIRAVWMPNEKKRHPEKALEGKRATTEAAVVPLQQTARRRDGRRAPSSPKWARKR